MRWPVADDPTDGAADRPAVAASRTIRMDPRTTQSVVRTFARQRPVSGRGFADALLHAAPFSSSPGRQSRGEESLPPRDCAMVAYGRSSVGSFWCCSLQNGTALTCPVFASRIQYL